MKKNFLLLLCACVVMAGNIYGQSRLYPNEFNLGQVKLLEGPFQHARDLNIKVLLEYNTDRLLAGFRKQAGLTPRDSTYKNWDGLDGHVGGHYLSALAMNYAATGNAECKRRMDYMLTELKACQDVNGRNYPDWGVGYIGAVPKSAVIWPALKKGELGPYRSAWVPWYNVHKMFAGLRDAWLYTGSELAKKMFLQCCDWTINITAGLSEEKMQSMLDTEHGGMNEILADAYQITGNQKYLDAAKRFSHRQLLVPMAQGEDNLDNKHANTQVPKAIGFARIGELDNDAEYEKAGAFFWQTVTQNRTLAFGGNSRREFFPAPASATDFVNDVEGPESCNTYNMLKLTEDLFREKPHAEYIDFYERALYNHILSTQHPEHGGYVYFTPARPQSYRVYSAPNEAMWCCVGSGMENHGKYNEMIYTHQQDSLFVNLFIASELNWSNKGITLKQETKFPYEEKTKLVFTNASGPLKLLIRQPSWVKDGGFKLMVNGKAVPITAYKSGYAMLSRTWKKGDVVEVMLPMQNSVEHLPNVPEYVALMHGPIVLAAKMGVEDLNGLVANDSRWGHIPSGRRLPLDAAPILIKDDIGAIANELVPVKGEPLHFTMPGLKIINKKPLELQPFFTVHDARYMLYWMALSNHQYQGYVDSLAALEKEKLALEKRTVDFVAPGEQQPEADHFIQQSISRTGNSQNAFWRDAGNGGYFSYQVTTGGETDLSLMVRYWGAEWGSRKFDIYIDDEKLVSEDNTGRWNRSEFFDISYPIPAAMLRGKQTLRVKFQSSPGNTAGAVYYVRLVKGEK